MDGFRVGLTTLIALAVAGCTMTGPGDTGPREAQIWSSRTTWDADGRPVTVTSHRTEIIAEPVRGPEWAFKGVWVLEEYVRSTDRMGMMKCVMRFDTAKVMDRGHMITLAPDCFADMRHIHAWRPGGKGIELLDSNGAVIADMQQRTGRFYRGVMRLAGGHEIDTFFTGYEVE